MKTVSDTLLTRRCLLLSLSALVARGAAAQPGKPSIRVRTFNHVTLSVSDPKRSLEFYQGLFGLPILARQGDNTISLGIGPGAHLALSRAALTMKPHINHFCMTTDGFDPDRLLAVLAAHGVTKGSPDGGSMKAWVRMCSSDLSGSKEGTPELYFRDPDGLLVQLQDTTYCGGSGFLGNVCPAAQSSAPKGRIAVNGLSHLTLAVSNRQRSMAFYQQLFAMPIQARQGATPLLAVGRGPQFIALGEGGTANGATPGVFNVAHVCLTMEGFHPDKVLQALADYGIKARGAGGPVGPLTAYVVMRMSDRGGAPEGTPELYFTDPDGIFIQLQDATYCGGSGYLGNVCP